MLSTMIHVKDTQSSFDYVRSVFRNNKRAFYSRYGDGDIYIMMGRDQANHNATPALTEEMKASFQIDHPLYLKGLAVNHPREKGMVRGLFAVFRDNKEMVDFLEGAFGSLDKVNFENPIFLHYLSVFKPQEVNTFLDEFIRPKRKMYIGSIPKERIEKIIGPVTHYIETPAKNSYAAIGAWWPQVIKNIQDVELVVPATGMATRVVNKRLWQLQADVQSFDIGSLVDIADGRQTRKWIRLAGHRVERHIVHADIPDISYFMRETKLLLYRAIKGLRQI